MVFVKSVAAIGALACLSACVHSTIYENRVETTYPEIGTRVAFEDTQLHVIQRGEGAPVLFIHGASGNAREFLASLEPEMPEGILRLSADRPGHGYSGRIKDAEQLGRQAEAMAAVLADQTDEPAVIIGHSFGGAVALRVALDHPEQVKAVVLLAPVTHDWGSGGINWYSQVAATPVIGHGFSQVGPIVGPGIARSSMDGLFSPAPAPDTYADDLGVNLLFRPPNFRANAKDMVNLQTELVQQQVRYADELSVPVVVFSGTYDTVIAPRLHAARLKREVPNLVNLIKMDDEGHMPHHGAAKEVAATIVSLARGESVQSPALASEEG